MPANNDYPVLDGIAPSWADVIIRITPAGAPLIDMKDIAAINTGAAVEVGEQRAGGRVMRTTTGSVSYEGSLTLYRTGLVALQRGLVIAAKAAGFVRGDQVLISLVNFGIQIQHTPPGSVEIYEQRLKGCRYLGRTLNSAEGTDAEQAEVPLHVKEIVDVIDGEEVVAL